MPHDTLLSRRRAAAMVAACLGSLTAAPALPAQPPEATLFSTNFAGTRLLDQESRRFDPASLAGRVVLFNFVYTGCSSTCPVQTRALAELQQKLPSAVRRQVRFVSIALDPLTDTPQMLKVYALRMGADLSRWSFLSGQPEDVEMLSSRLRLFRSDAVPRKLDEHNTHLWLVDRRGRLVQRYSGNPPDEARLLRDLAALTAAARDSTTTPAARAAAPVTHPGRAATRPSTSSSAP